MWSVRYLGNEKANLLKSCKFILKQYKEYKKLLANDKQVVSQYKVYYFRLLAHYSEAQRFLKE